MTGAQDVRRFVDQTSYAIELPASPQRIVSLVPSQTELLFDLGLGDRLVGCTRYCLHPARARECLTVVGGTKRIDPARVLALSPDLVIGNKEENDRASIEPLRAAVPTWLSDIATLPEALAMIDAIGALTGVEAVASALVRNIETAWTSLREAGGCRVAYFIWRKPWMAAGNNTFIDDVLSRLGFSNVFADEPRYPETTLAALRERAPDVVLLSSEPFPFAEAHIAEVESALPASQVALVDGEMFSWYGSRLLLAPEYLRDVVDSLSAGTLEAVL